MNMAPIIVMLEQQRRKRRIIGSDLLLENNNKQHFIETPDSKNASIIDFVATQRNEITSELKLLDERAAKNELPHTIELEKRHYYQGKLALLHELEQSLNLKE